MKYNKTISLECQKCEIEYEKPFNFIKWNEDKPNVFYKWSLMFCDGCRREKEKIALKRLPDVIKALLKPTNNE